MRIEDLTVEINEISKKLTQLKDSL